MSLSERIATGLKATFVAQVVNALATGALMLALTRYLMTPSEYGLLYFAISILVVAKLVATLGLAKSGAKYVNEYLERDPSQLPYILRRTLWFVLLSTVVVSTAVVTLSGPVATRFGRTDVVPLLVAGGGYVFLSALDEYVRLTFQGLNRLDYAAVVRTVSSVGRFLFAVAFVLLGYGALGALFGYIVGFGLAVVIGLWLIYSRYYTEHTCEEPESGLSGRIVRYSLPLTAIQGSYLLETKVDAILVGLLLNPTAVGFYMLGKQIVDFVSIPANAIDATISPALGAEKAGDRIEQAARLFEQSIVHILLLYVPAGVGLFLVADPMIRYVFGAGYLGAVPVLQVFSIWVVITALSKITSNTLDYLGDAGTRAKVAGGSAVANLLLNLVLIPRMGVAGAAVATVLTNGAYTGTALYLIYRELPLDLGYLARQVALVAAVGATMGAGVWLTLSRVDSLVTLAAAIAVGVVIWATTATASGALEPRRMLTFLS